MRAARLWAVERVGWARSVPHKRINRQVIESQQSSLGSVAHLRNAWNKSSPELQSSRHKQSAIEWFVLAQDKIRALFDAIDGDGDGVTLHLRNLTRTKHVFLQSISLAEFHHGMTGRRKQQLRCYRSLHSLCQVAQLSDFILCSRTQPRWLWWCYMRQATYSCCFGCLGLTLELKAPIGRMLWNDSMPTAMVRYHSRNSQTRAKLRGGISERCSPGTLGVSDANLIWWLDKITLSYSWCIAVPTTLRWKGDTILHLCAQLPRRHTCMWIIKVYSYVQIKAMN